MDAYAVSPTRSTPRVDLDAQSGIARLSGSSYPENASRFYQPVFDWLRNYCQFLKQDGTRRLLLDLELHYINSSTSKILMMLFDILEDAAREGASVEVVWRYDPENETALECGEEFKEDIQDMPFTLQPEERLQAP